jgi:2-methylcitrate dehydratase PrpD
MTTHLEALGRWVSEVEYEHLPADTLRAARYQVLNMIAAARPATRSADTASISAAVGALASGGGRSTVAGSSERRAPVDAALANAAFSMAHDHDDIVWMGHTCHSAVFAPLAVAEHEGLDGRAFLTAVVVANEIGGRIGASSWLGPLNGQMVSFIHLVGAAAATAKLLNLDAERTTHAMAIALAQPGFPLQPGFMTPTSKLLVAAIPTATGIRAAYFAREGMTGDPRILEDRRGFWHRFSFAPMAVMLGELSSFWVTQTLTVKTYPGCYYFQTACEALDRIQQRRGRLTLDRVNRIDIATTQLGLAVTRFAAEYAREEATIRPVNVNFDVSWTAAVMLQAGRLTSSELQPEWLSGESDGLRRWQSRIHVHHDPALTAKVIGSARSVSMGRRALRSLRLRDMPRLLRRYSEEYKTPRLRAGQIGRFVWSLATKSRPRPAPVRPTSDGQSTPLYFPNRVSVLFADGSTENEQIDLPEGSFCAESAEQALKAKFFREMAPCIGEAEAQAAFAAGLRLEELPLSEFVAASGLPSQVGITAAVVSHQ